MKLKMKRSIYVILALVLVCSLFCADDKGSGKNYDTNTEPVNINEKLNKLGFNTNLGPPKDYNGNAFPDSYHPLRKPFAVYNKLHEIYAAGIVLKEDNYHKNRKHGLINDGKKRPYTFLYSKPMGKDKWEEQPLHAFAGDIDGDGIEEIINLIHYVAGKLTVLKIINYDEKVRPENYEDKNGVPTYIGEDPEKTYVFPGRPGSGMGIDRKNDDTHHYKIDAALGDFDQDGLAEIAAIIGDTLLVFDDASNEHKIIEEINLTSFYLPPWTDLMFNHVASGDMDEDGKDDIIVSSGFDETPESHVRIFSYEPSEKPELLKEGVAIFTYYYKLKHEARIYYEDPENGNEIGTQYANLAVGDIDGDRKLEVVFAGDINQNGANDYYVLIMDDFENEYKFLTVNYEDDRKWSAHKSLALEFFYPEGISSDATEDGSESVIPQAAVLVDNKVLRYNTNSMSLYVDPDIKIDTFDKDLAVTGDVIGDGKDNVVIQRGGDMRIFGYTDDENTIQWTELKRLDIDREHYSSICLVNADFDSDVVKYLNKHEVLLSDPEILAVLASPPYMSHLNQNLNVMETIFGKGKTDTTEQTHNVGINAGFSIGAEAEMPVLGCTGACASTKYTFGVSFDYTTTKTISKSVTKSYSCPAGEDHVILMCVPLDLYYYETISSPDSDSVGSVFSIDIPRGAQTVPFEREYFNEVMEGMGLKEYIIGSDVLPHEIGNVFSYPTSNEMNSKYKYKKNFISTGEEIITPSANADGTQSLEIGFEEGRSHSFGFDVSISNQTELTAGGMLYGVEMGIHYGYEYKFTVSNSFTMGTTISNIPDSSYSMGDYKIGLMTYSEDLNDEMSFIVVNYWWFSD